MKITLEIPSDKVSFFLELVENLNFSTVDIENQSIPEWQIDEAKKRIYAIKNGEMKIELWEDVKEEIFKKKWNLKSPFRKLQNPN